MDKLLKKLLQIMFFICNIIDIKRLIAHMMDLIYLPIPKEKNTSIIYKFVILQLFKLKC